MHPSVSTATPIARVLSFPSSPPAQVETVQRTTSWDLEIPIADAAALTVPVVIVGSGRQPYEYCAVPVPTSIGALVFEPDIDQFVEAIWRGVGGSLTARACSLRIETGPDGLVLVALRASGRSVKFLVDGWPLSMMQALLPSADTLLVTRRARR